MDGIMSLISHLADSFAADSALPHAAPSSPNHKWAAIHAIEDDGDLSKGEEVHAIKLICLDTGFANTILSVCKKALCTHLIKEELYGSTNI